MINIKRSKYNSRLLSRCRGCCYWVALRAQRSSLGAWIRRHRWPLWAFHDGRLASVVMGVFGVLKVFKACGIRRQTHHQLGRGVIKRLHKGLVDLRCMPKRTQVTAFSLAFLIRQRISRVSVDRWKNQATGSQHKADGFHSMHLSAKNQQQHKKIEE
jgi:hypothetical protein